MTRPGCPDWCERACHPAHRSGSYCDPAIGAVHLLQLRTDQQPVMFIRGPGATDSVMAADQEDAHRQAALVESLGAGQLAAAVREAAEHLPEAT